MFYVTVCKGCNRPQVCIVKNPTTYTIKCRMCGKSTKMKDRKGNFNTGAHGPFNDGMDARKCCARLSEEIMNDKL
jgi:transcription elongation factor Elf1